MCSEADATVAPRQNLEGERSVPVGLHLQPTPDWTPVLACFVCRKEVSV